MPEPMMQTPQASSDPKEGEAQKILQEDIDDTVNESEIQRIVRLYTGREASEEEMSRFSGTKESELKVLTTYLNDLREQDKMNMNANKTKNDLALKGMKAVGENQIANFKANPMMPQGTPPMMPPGDGGAPMMPPQGMPPQGPNMNGQNDRTIRDGRFSLVKFA